ncbi:MAG: chemotaxis protein CheD [Candidatus Kariarchaeaceae archaeon]|jgi:chemotaxis protein CheD
MEFDISIDREVIEKFFPKNMLNAGIGEIVMGESPSFLSATALGSCVGTVIYDKLNKIAALAHIAFSTAKEVLDVSPEILKRLPGRYADVAIPTAIRMLERKGVLKLEAKIVGGSNMFSYRRNSLIHIGRRNVDAVIDNLKEFGIPIRGKDVDGRSSRSIKFFPENAMMEVKKTVRGKTRYDYISEVYLI